MEFCFNSALYGLGLPKSDFVVPDCSAIDKNGFGTKIMLEVFCVVEISFRRLKQVILEQNVINLDFELIFAVLFFFVVGGNFGAAIRDHSR